MERSFTLKKRKASRKDFSHVHTLGTGVIPPSGTIKSFATDILDQGAINDCTAYTAVEIRKSKTGKTYDPTAFWQGELSLGGDPSGVTLDTQGAAGIKIGWTVQGDSQPSEKATSYLYVRNSPFSSIDMFDTLREAMMNYGALSAGLDWYREWTDSPGAVIPHSQQFLEGGHDVKLCGLNCINGVDYIEIQNSWGDGVGDHGIYHLDRYMANKVFAEYGVIYWIDNSDVQIQRMGLIESLCVNVINLLKKLIAQKTGYPPPTPTTYLWDTPANARHSIRVICDEMGLPYVQKNILTACVEVESGFNPKAIHLNKDGQGHILSTDYGIVQVNDFWWIGATKQFPSTDYVLNNPETCVRWMVKMFLEGKQNMWCSYTSGAYKRYL